MGMGQALQLGMQGLSPPLQAPVSEGQQAWSQARQQIQLPDIQHGGQLPAGQQWLGQGMVFPLGARRADAQDDARRQAEERQRQLEGLLQREEEQRQRELAEQQRQREVEH